jgi:folate-binding protein YgfZ
VPVNGREIVEGTIAAEVGLVERTVSFTKGCFTGQELVARLDARGSKVARHCAGVVIEGSRRTPGPTLVGASVLTADDSHEVGRLSSVAWSPGRVSGGPGHPPPPGRAARGGLVRGRAATGLSLTVARPRAGPCPW